MGNYTPSAPNVHTPLGIDPAVEFALPATNHNLDPTDHAPADAVTSADRDWWQAAGNQGDPGHAVDTDLDSECGYDDRDQTLDYAGWWLAVDGDADYQAESERREVERHMARRRSIRVDAEDEARIYGYRRA